MIPTSILYSSLNEVLCKQLPEIHKKIEESIVECGYGDVIEKVECYLECHIWGQDTSWRIDVEVDSYPCDDSGRPFALGGFVRLEEIAKREVLYFKTQMYNSFNKAIAKNNPTVIPYSEVNNINVVNECIQQVADFLLQFYGWFMGNLKIFVDELRKLKAEWAREE